MTSDLDWNMQYQKVNKPRFISMKTYCGLLSIHASGKRLWTVVERGEANLQEIYQ